MPVEDFPGNQKNVLGAKANPKEEKKIERVVQGEVVQKPAPLGRRFKSLFFGGDFKGAATYVFSDVLIPAFKNMIVDAGRIGIERVVLGSSPGPRRYEPGRPRVTYNNPVQRSYDPRTQTAMLPGQPPRQQRRDEGELLFDLRSDADDVLEKFNDVLEKYEAVSVSDLHEMIGLPAAHTDQKWGWTSALGVAVRQVRNGYVLDLPPAESL